MYLKITFFINYTRKRKGEYFLYDIFLVTRENDLKKKSICTYESYYSPIVQRFPFRIF